MWLRLLWQILFLNTERTITLNWHQFLQLQLNSDPSLYKNIFILLINLMFQITLSSILAPIPSTTCCATKNSLAIKTKIITTQSLCAFESLKKKKIVLLLLHTFPRTCTRKLNCVNIIPLANMPVINFLNLYMSSKQVKCLHGNLNI